MDLHNAVNVPAAIARLMRFLAIEGVTGHESAVAAAITKGLRDLGVPKSAIRHDDANSRIPLPTECGNLIVQLPGTHPGPRILFSAHLDTVPLCAGAQPVRRGNRIVAEGATALGGDNRTGCAVLVTLVESLLSHKIPHPPLTLLFTVREESGLFGSRNVDIANLGHPVMGFNFDGRSASEVTIGAVGAERWTAEIYGRAAHAGVHPEYGISAIAVASLAIADIVRNGWFGKVVKSRADCGNTLKLRDRKAENKRGTKRVELVSGTSNVGVFGGRDDDSAGAATNVVTDFVRLLGESRSHEAPFARLITTAYKDAFRAAALQIRDSNGRSAKIKFASRVDYYPFRLSPAAPVVQHASRAIAKCGSKPNLRIANGGLDANWLVRHKVPTVTLGAGQNAIHTVDEFVDVSEFAAGCRLAVSLAALDAV